MQLTVLLAHSLKTQPVQQTHPVRQLAPHAHILRSVRERAVVITLANEFDECECLCLQDNPRSRYDSTKVGNFHCILPTVFENSTSA
jgi:hypothetical protein